MPSITVRAFAKINLSLRVTGIRADGFHEVRTVLQSIDLFDRVTCRTRRGPFEIRCTAPGVPTGRANLVWMAAERLWQAADRPGEPRDVVVTLQKRIPMQAGLGGGSSNAAAALIGLRRVFRLRVPDRQLWTIAAALGSDVPYFLVGGTALGLGRGEEVYALEDLPRLWVVLVIPSFGVATKDAYGWFDEADGRRTLSVDPFINDLEPAVIRRHPIVGEIKSSLMKLGASMAAMSGSGSTVFGVFVSRQAAHTAARRLKRGGAATIITRFHRRPRP